MSVYLDVVFVLNGVVNYLLLSASARLVGSVCKRGRMVCAAVLGAAYAALTFVPGLGFLSGALWRILVFAIMLLLAFGLSGKTVPLGGIFLALSLALSGLVLMLSGLLGAQVWLLEGRAFYAIDAATLILLAGAMYLGLWLLLQGSMAHVGGGVAAASIELQGRREKLTLLRDSGNTLRDPFTGRAIPVVEWRVFAKLLPEARQELQLCTTDAAGSMEKLHAKLPKLPMRLIPYRAVGTERALILAVRCDRLCVGGKAQRGVFVAISPNAVSENGTYEGLIGEGV